MALKLGERRISGSAQNKDVTWLGRYLPERRRKSRQFF
jgi:hypothetical protein